MCLDDFSIAVDGDTSVLPVEPKLRHPGGQPRAGRAHSVDCYLSGTEEQEYISEKAAIFRFTMKNHTAGWILCYRRPELSASNLTP